MRRHHWQADWPPNDCGIDPFSPVFGAAPACVQHQPCRAGFGWNQQVAMNHKVADSVNRRGEHHQHHQHQLKSCRFTFASPACEPPCHWTNSANKHGSHIVWPTRCGSRRKKTILYLRQHITRLVLPRALATLRRSSDARCCGFRGPEKEEFQLMLMMLAFYSLNPSWGGFRGQCV